MNIFILVLNEISDYSFDDLGVTEFAQAMQDKYKVEVEGDAVTAYREFYLGEKMGFAKWSRRNAPEWVVT